MLTGEECAAAAAAAAGAARSIGIAVVVVRRRRVGVGGAAPTGIAHHRRVGRRAVVVGRWVRVVERAHSGTAVVLVHHNDHGINITRLSISASLSLS